MHDASSTLATYVYMRNMISENLKKINNYFGFLIYYIVARKAGAEPVQKESNNIYEFSINLDVDIE